MANLGTIAVKAARTVALSMRPSAAPALLCLVQLGSWGPLLLSVARDNTQGNPTAPSQSHPRPGILKDIWWPVAVGARTFSIDVKYTGTAPRIVVKQDPVLGIPADVIATADAGSGWVTIAYSFTAAAAGVVRIWRERVDSDPTHTLNWDNIVTT